MQSPVFYIRNTYSIYKKYIRNTYREELREAMVNFGTRCTDEWVHFDLKNNFVLDFFDQRVLSQDFLPDFEEKRSHTPFLSLRKFSIKYSQINPQGICLHVWRGGQKSRWKDWLWRVPGYDVTWQLTSVNKRNTWYI